MNPPPEAIEYPYWDGKMIAESPLHGDAIMYALLTLRGWFADHGPAQVGTNMFLYYLEGDSTKRFTPDLFVVRGLEEMPGPCFKLWEVGRPPTFVLEMASAWTEQPDRSEEQALCASMGVDEYWRFHPTRVLSGAGQSGVRLEGGVLQGSVYEPLDRGQDGSIRSNVLGLDVRVDELPEMGHMLRFRDPGTGQDLLSLRDLELAKCDVAQRQREAERAHRAEVAARRDAALEVARLRAQIARLESGRGKVVSGSESG